MNHSLLTRETSRGGSASASALKGRRIPAQGATLGIRGPPVRRSEGTPQRAGLGRRPLITNMRRSFRTPGDAVDGTQGVALGWYAVSRWDTRNRSCSTDQSHSSAHLIELRQVIQGACPRLCKSPGTRGETSAHRGWMIDWLVARKKHPVHCPLLLARASLSQVRGSCGPEDRAPREPRLTCLGSSRTTPTNLVDDAPQTTQGLGWVMASPPQRGGAYQPRVKPWVSVETTQAF